MQAETIYSFYLIYDFVYQVSSVNTNSQMGIGSAETAIYQQIQAKEADVQALTELTRALEKKVSAFLNHHLCRSPLKQRLYISFARSYL